MLLLLPKSGTQSGLPTDVQALRSCVHILVAPPAQIDHNPGAVRQSRAEPAQVRKGVRGLQGRNNALQAANAHKCLKRLLICDRKVLCAPELFQVAVLWANAWVVQPAAGSRTSLPLPP